MIPDLHTKLDGMESAEIVEAIRENTIETARAFDDNTRMFEENTRVTEELIELMIALNRTMNNPPLP